MTDVCATVRVGRWARLAVIRIVISALPPILIIAAMEANTGRVSPPKTNSPRRTANAHPTGGAIGAPPRFHRAPRITHPLHLTAGTTVHATIQVRTNPRIANASADGRVIYANIHPVQVGNAKMVAHVSTTLIRHLLIAIA